MTDIFTEDNKEIPFKHKSRISTKTIQNERDSKKNKYTVYQKQMVYYSKNMPTNKNMNMI